MNRHAPDISQWRFRPMQPGEINIDPIEGEFFTTEALDSITDALVRESIQNSLDAAAGTGPVTVSFCLTTIAANTLQNTSAHYFSGLSPHLNAAQSGLASVPALDGDIRCLIVEDFGTRGLQGDEAQYDDLEDNGRRNDFYYFWRNIGRTRKESTDIGRWGLGKTVFQATSRINAFFGLTCRSDDGRRLLMGQSALRIHRVSRQRFAPYGYFGRFEGDLALPIADAAQISAFESNFGTTRRNRPGLSIVIPFIDPDIRIFPSRREKRTLSCFQSVIGHYFFPILSGALIVVLNDGDRTKRLDADTLSAMLESPRLRTAKNFRGIVDLARWAIRQPERHLTQVALPTPGRAPKLESNLIEKRLLESARERFQQKQRLAFKLSVPVLPVGEKKPLHTTFHVYLERDDSLERAEDVFIRQGITIPEVSSLRFKGVRAIVAITDPRLSAFLGDSENPAHTDWERNNKRFKSKYRLGPSTLDFVKSSPRNMVGLLTRPKRGVDRYMLRHLFALPAEGQAGSQPVAQAAAGEGAGTGEPATPPEIAAANRLKLSRVKGGFRLSLPADTAPVPFLLTIWVAYEVRSGNPFKKYTTLDFDLSQPPIAVSGEGFEVATCRGNVMQLVVRRPDFNAALTGFDTHRDLRIRTEP